jgi:hypothetical protein
MPRLKAGGLSTKARDPIFAQPAIPTRADLFESVMSGFGPEADIQRPVDHLVGGSNRRAAGSHFGSLSARIPSL